MNILKISLMVLPFSLLIGCGGNLTPMGANESTAGREAEIAISGAPMPGEDLTKARRVSGGCQFPVYTKGNLINPKLVTLSPIEIALKSFQTANYITGSNAGSVVMAKVESADVGRVVNWSEYAAAGTFRVVYISRTKCEMNSTTLVSAAISDSLEFRTNQGKSGIYHEGHGGPILYVMPGETWYLMSVNYMLDKSRGSKTFGLPTGTSSCQAGRNCGMIFKTN